jgi:aryl-alcohol dehydrogenase-like predicted oxidoreductase
LHLRPFRPARLALEPRRHDLRRRHRHLAIDRRARRRADDTAGRRTQLDFPPIDRARVDPIVHELRAIAQTLEATPAQVALAWLLGREATSTVIVGARNEQQLNDNLRSAEIALTAEQRARLDRVSQPPEPYPYWMQRLHDRDRVLG